MSAGVALPILLLRTYAGVIHSAELSCVCKLDTKWGVNPMRKTLPAPTLRLRGESQISFDQPAKYAFIRTVRGFTYSSVLINPKIL